jgi:hypothetical protein
MAAALVSTVVYAVVAALSFIVYTRAVHQDARRYLTVSDQGRAAVNAGLDRLGAGLKRLTLLDRVSAIEEGSPEARRP